MYRLTTWLSIIYLLWIVNTFFKKFYFFTNFKLHFKFYFLYKGKIRKKQNFKSSLAYLRKTTFRGLIYSFYDIIIAITINKNTKNIANTFAASQNVTAINFNIDHAIFAIIIHIIIKMVNTAIATPWIALLFQLLFLLNTYLKIISYVLLLCQSVLLTLNCKFYIHLIVDFFSLKAFKITVILLKTIAKLAIIGFIVIPIGLKIPTAIGIIKLL